MTIDFQPFGHIPRYFKNPLTGEMLEFERVCTEYEEGEKFSWTGKLNSHGMTDNYIYSLESTENGTTIFKQEDGIHGPYGCPLKTA